MFKKKDKDKSITFKAENLAVPEVHVEHDAEDVQKSLPEEDKEIVYENLAVPEYHPKCRKRKKENKED